MGALILEVETRENVLFGKLGKGLSGDMKKQAWEEAAAKVNEVGVGEMRIPEKALRKKWTDMASMTKKKESARRREMSATGGGECAMLYVDWKPLSAIRRSSSLSQLS